MRGILGQTIDRFSRGSSHEAVLDQLNVASYADAEKTAKKNRILMYATGSLALLAGVSVASGYNDIFDSEQVVSSSDSGVIGESGLSLTERGMEVVQDVMMTIGAAALLSMSLESRKFSQIAQRRMTELEQS